MACPACSANVPDGSYRCLTCGATNARNSLLARASYTLGIMSWFFLGIFFSVPAIITGHLARRAIRHSNGALSGDRFVRVGLIYAYANIAAYLIIVIALAR